jgi:predicted alpha/beta hydrolase
MKSSEHSGISIERVAIRALDGAELGGMLFRPKDAQSFEQAVLFNSGGGISAFHYRKFAAFLARSGVPTLTYDYRGIGASRPSSLHGFEASLEDWSEYDCGGAIDWMASRFPGVPLIGIGHSIGNLLFGGARNASLLSRLIMICPHTGFVGDYRFVYWLPMAVIWHGLMPLLTRLAGYFPASRVGLGDDLPRGIAMQWARQLRPGLRPGRKNSQSRANMLIGRCKSLSRPAMLLTFSDDAFATSRGAKRLASYFPRLQFDHRVVTPSSVELRRIGHFGAFRKGAAESLWPHLLALILREPLSHCAGTGTTVIRDGDIWSPPLACSAEGSNLDNQDAHVSVRHSST